MKQNPSLLERLAGALVFLGLLVTSPSAGGSELPKPQPDPGALQLSVRIKGETGEVFFQSTAGKDLGDYVGPGFIQRNIEVHARDIPFTVFFRPDKDGKRVEVVFEWGDVLKGKPRHLSAYTAQILSGTKVLATVEVPQHYWLSRWRWQSSPRPIVKTVDELKEAKLVPPYANIATVPLPKPAPPYKIMETSSVTTYMPTTGERDDIGLVPESYAAYLATGNAALEPSIFAWAEASGTFPWHMRDKATHAPLSYKRHPDATTYYDQSKGNKKPELFLLPAENIAIDGAHQPALAYVPFLLTGDPYYLEELQFATTYTLGNRPGHNLIIRHDQTREFAWTLRSLFYAAQATPDKVPSWILPRSYWKEILAKNLRWTITNYVNNPSPKTAIFASGVDKERMPFWQEDYLATVLGLGVWMGNEEWRPVLNWKVRSTIARTDGKSGWPRSHPIFYYPDLKTTAGVEATSWKQLAELNKLSPNNREELDEKLDPNYLAFARGALMMANIAGNNDANDPYKWLDSKTREKFIPWRWALQ